MAKAQREEVFRRLPQVDLVAGPAEIYDLPDLLAGVAERRQRAGPGGGARVLAVDRKVRPLDRQPATDYRTGEVVAFVTIMEGCDKKCAYCIVPTTRGQEVSRPLDEILDEVQRLARAGYRQVTLLGQNVNSYGKRFPDGSGWVGPGRRRALLELSARPSLAEDAAETDASGPRLVDFPALLRAIDGKTNMTGCASRRATRSTPTRSCSRRWRSAGASASTSTFRSSRAPTACSRDAPRLHGRGLPRADRTPPGAGAAASRLSTDIIVGFPGETDADFEATRL